MDNLMNAVRSSDKLRRHVGFLFEHGSTYLVHNGNVLFHACVPMNEDGSFCAVNHQGQMLSGRAYYDYADRLARRAWHEHDQVSLDWMWYLWCGRFSPLSGRVVKTFERTYFADRSTWEEPRDPYFSHTEDPAMCARVLEEFGADVERGVIINGHTPVHAAAGESPVKAGGRLVVIDGGFCQAYHSTTGIAGYTLIADPEAIPSSPSAPRPISRPRPSAPPTWTPRAASSCRAWSTATPTSTRASPAALPSRAATPPTSSRTSSSSGGRSTTTSRWTAPAPAPTPPSSTPSATA